MDLRAATTYEEVKRAVEQIDNIRTYEQVVEEVGGRTGVLLSCVNHDFWGIRFAKAMEGIEQAKERADVLVELDKQARSFPDPPPTYLTTLKREYARAFIAQQHLVNVFMEDIELVKKAIREARIALQKYDMNVHWYGRTSFKGLTEMEKELRKTHTCGLCEQKGHWKVDHLKWVCRHCKEAAPHHNPNDCRKNDKWMVWRNAANDKKMRRKREIRGTYKDGKSRPLPIDDNDNDGGWSQVNGWDDLYDDWFGDDGEHNLNT